MIGLGMRFEDMGIGVSGVVKDAVGIFRVRDPGERINARGKVMGGRRMFEYKI